MERELQTSGVLTSLNFPHGYLSNINRVQRIQVLVGNTIWIRFTQFDVERLYDTVTVTDRDGTQLGLYDRGGRGNRRNSGNSEDDWRDEIVSKTEEVEVLFCTNEGGDYEGWRLEWGKDKAILIACIIPNVFDRNDQSW